MLIEVEVGPGQWQVEPISVRRFEDITEIWIDGRKARFRRAIWAGGREAMKPMQPWLRNLAWFGTGVWFHAFWTWVWR